MEKRDFREGGKKWKLLFGQLNGAEGKTSYYYK
jgi:hypothetical protein